MRYCEKHEHSYPNGILDCPVCKLEVCVAELERENSDLREEIQTLYQIGS